jgi:hypothetical protein
MISSSIPFPPIYWWIKACQSKTVTIDLGEHYQKMSYRNRYYLAAPEGKILMSLPLENGRNQRVSMKDVKLSDETNWQSNQWKTIVSLYNRSPFFEYFEHYFKPLFEKPFESLHAFNIEGIHQINNLLKLGLNIETTEEFIKQYPEEITDLRNTLKPQSEPEEMKTIAYYQVFEDRAGFQSNCSILDLLFCDGMAARDFLLK